MWTSRFHPTHHGHRIRFFAALLLLVVTPTFVSATWSVNAVDLRTERIVIASATCVSQARLEGYFGAKGLMDIQAIVVPGVAVAAAQANVDQTRENQRLIYRELKKRAHPARILTLLQKDPMIEERQFGIVDLQGRFVGFSGRDNGQASLSVQGHVPNTQIYFSIQGNILSSNEVIHDAVDAFLGTKGSLTDRVMAAMEAADKAGGDSRCNCETEPIPNAACDGKTSHVAYLLAADPDDREGESFNDGKYALYINVTDENIRSSENANPVITLRQRYNDLPRARRSDPDKRG
ncbi:MAG: DUF1028 domain-containing protein [SAR202 cluster bacterium]|jgi:uncharacterized Ntn-hydrolase superfamily protein|nr:DUF1028 domain-containing protein [SAR202 cluster bacterium]